MARLARKNGSHNGSVKDVMVHLDGTAADKERLAAAIGIADAFQGHVTGLYLNVMPAIVAGEDAAYGVAEMMEYARETGDKTEAKLRQRLAKLHSKIELRRFDVWNDSMASIAAREARAADTFVELRPNGVIRESDHLIEGVLFGAGRHLLLVPEGARAKTKFAHVVIAWNGSRESARALTEAMPYLHAAKKVTVLSIIDDGSDEDKKLGADAVAHLKHHGIKAVLAQVKSRAEIGKTLLSEAKKRKADLIVMGGYGHSRLREWLLGGVTDKMLHNAPVPLLVAH